jgi:hypothetical protein
MITRADMETELKQQLIASANSTLFPDSRITKVIQDSHRWATGMFPFRALMRAKKTNSIANAEYYDIPDEFKTHGVIRLEIDGKEYNPKAYEDVLDYKNEYPNSKKRIFGQYANYFFPRPIPTSDGTDNILVWGAVQANKLESSTDTTIFSNRDISGNEAIVRKAYSVLIKPFDSVNSTKEEGIAKGMLMEIFKEEQKNTQRDQRLQHPKFEVHDFYAGRGGISAVGRFSYDPSETY